MTLDENYHLHDMHYESVNIQYLKYFHSASQSNLRGNCGKNKVWRMVNGGMQISVLFAIYVSFTTAKVNMNLKLIRGMHNINF